MFCFNAILNEDEIAPGFITPYGKKVGYSSEEKLLIVEKLTPLEKDAYLLLLEGYTVRETSKKLHIGYIITNRYKRAIFRKLHITTQAELIMNYHDIGGG